jgi:prepilin-type N-terminal cleavage/methylation domain-containing protein
MKRGTEAFTLVEMLVALALLSLMSAYAFMAISGMSRAKEIEAKMAMRADASAAERHLRQTIGDMRNVFRNDKTGATDLAFVGQANSLEFVAPLNDVIAIGGLYALRYGLTEDGLSLGFEVFRPNKNTFDYNSKELLLKDVSAVSFRYFGDSQDGKPAVWRSTWVKIPALPSIIEVTLKRGDKKPVIFLARHAG